MESSQNKFNFFFYHVLKSKCNTEDQSSLVLVYVKLHNDF